MCFIEKRTAVDIDVCPERRSPRYHETCLDLESVAGFSAAVSKPRSVWLPVSKQRVVSRFAGRV